MEANFPDRKTGNIIAENTKNKKQRIICDKCRSEVTLSKEWDTWKEWDITYFGIACFTVYSFSKVHLPTIILDMSCLESVIYYASYLITNLDEDKRNIL